jgi:hypothetical protein
MGAATHLCQNSIMRMFLCLLSIFASINVACSQTLYGGRSHFPKTAINSESEGINDSKKDEDEEVSFRDKIATVWQANPMKVAYPLLLGAAMAFMLQLALYKLEQSQQNSVEKDATNSTEKTINIMAKKKHKKKKS